MHVCSQFTYTQLVTDHVKIKQVVMHLWLSVTMNIGLSLFHRNTSLHLPYHLWPFVFWEYVRKDERRVIMFLKIAAT